MSLKSPFPYIGGKSRAASLIWSRLGDPVNYVVPFMGSLPDLLLRPAPDDDSPRARIETVNDADCYLANAWRAIRAKPKAVAAWCNWPVSEADLEARHKYLVGLRTMEPVVPKAYDRHPSLRRAYLAGYLGNRPTYAAAFREKIRADPNYFDVRFAAWWVWGACCWIGSGWCPEAIADRLTCQIPHLSHGGLGVNRINGPGKKLPDIGGHAGGTGRGVHQVSGPGKKRPRSARGQGQGVANGGDYPWVHSLIGPEVRSQFEGHRPQLADAFARGRGVHGKDSTETCRERKEWLVDWMSALADRLRTVRICCYDWKRVCGSDSTTTRLGTTGILFDPPYAHSVPRMHAWVAYLSNEGKSGDNPEPPPARSSNRSRSLYSNDATQDVDRLVAEVQIYCADRGRDRKFRIALCGLQGEHDILESLGWSVVPWKAGGGYGNQNKVGNANATRERIWFSPGCLDPGRLANGTLPGQMSMIFDETEDE